MLAEHSNDDDAPPRSARRRAIVALAVVLAVAVAGGCGRHDEHAHPRPPSGPLRLGYVGGPHAAAVYAAVELAGREGRGTAFTDVSFQTSGDIGYALIAGDLDAGFIETAQAAALLKSVNGLRAVGAVTFPYGVTLVLRKDLDLRLGDLAGRTVAVVGRRCRLLHQFQADAGRLGVNADAIAFVPLPFSQMIPALEARKVDAILTRGGHALLAAAQQHHVLYQNWDVTGDDACCPQTLAQVELVLVARVRGVCPLRVLALVAMLSDSADAPPGVLRAAVAARTRIPLAVLEPFPVASFVALTPEQQAELSGAATVAATDADLHKCDEACRGHGH